MLPAPFRPDRQAVARTFWRPLLTRLLSREGGHARQQGARDRTGSRGRGRLVDAAGRRGRLAPSRARPPEFHRPLAPNTPLLVALLTAARARFDVQVVA